MSEHNDKLDAEDVVGHTRRGAVGDDDVAGHTRRGDDDVEGHTRFDAAGDADDVAGHARRGDDDDDVEGHYRR